MLNDQIRYIDSYLTCDGVSLEEIAQAHSTPTYVYTGRRIQSNYERIRTAFAPLNAHIHYSIKANGNLVLLRMLAELGAGMDAVSGGEVFRAISAGTNPQDIVFAGVGKTLQELEYAVNAGVGWFNVENLGELDYLQRIAFEHDISGIRIALRLNPGVTANTHPHIATGHDGAKFGLTAETIVDVLGRTNEFPRLDFAGIHVHIGSQLHDTDATVSAVKMATDIASQHPSIRSINIGGGLPVAYTPADQVPNPEAFADSLAPILDGYHVILEPGRSIVADAGLLLTRVLYVKHQAGQVFVIVDASMNELLRPALYQAEHAIVTVNESDDKVQQDVQIVGPVCETADVLGRNIALPEVKAGDLLAILTTGAYGSVMAANYNARLRPAEVLVDDAGSLHLIARRETWDDQLARELLD